MTKSWENIAREQADTLLKQQAVIARLEEKLEAIKTWLEDAPEPMFLEPGRSPFISETSMEVWLEKCPVRFWR